jgi:hypothetical protein
LLAYPSRKEADISLAHVDYYLPRDGLKTIGASTESTDENVYAFKKLSIS